MRCRRQELVGKANIHFTHPVSGEKTVRQQAEPLLLSKGRWRPLFGWKSRAGLHKWASRRPYARRGAAYSGALPNGMPLTLIDRSASSSTSQLRLPSLSDLASAWPGIALPAMSGPKSLTAAIVLSKPRAWIVIAAVGFARSRRIEPAKSASTAGATTCEGANSIWTGPELMKAASTFAALSSERTGPSPCRLRSEIHSLAAALMSMPLSFAATSIFDGVNAPALGGRRPTGRLRRSAERLRLIALCGPALAAPS